MLHSIGHIANIFFILSSLVILRGLKLIPTSAFLWSIFTLPTTFLLTGFLFSESYMPDQYKYLESVMSIRENFNCHSEASLTVCGASWLMALTPFPTLVSVYSIGLLNKFYAILFISWLYSRKILVRPIFYLFLLYPSFIFYSSIALRDVLILVFMSTSLIFYLEGRKLFMAVALALLLIIKPQNALLMLVLFFLMKIFNDEHFSKALKLCIVILLLILINLFQAEVIDAINIQKLAFFSEDGGEVDSYNPIHSWDDLLSQLGPSVLKFWFAPFIWSSSGALQVFQSLENIVVFILLSYSLIKCWFTSRNLFFVWVLFIVIVSFIYGLVISNDGTLARYRFPFVFLFILGVYHGSQKLK